MVESLQTVGSRQYQASERKAIRQTDFFESHSIHDY